ncbi:MAG: hypothetical protein WCW44_02115 [archaeon]|jgi:short-subunit dehydrogenase
MNKKLIIIAGARGDLGKFYYAHFQKKYGANCIGLSSKINSPNTGLLKIDLFDKNACSTFVQNLRLSKYKEIILIHSIGRFLFEEKGVPIIDENHDGIEDGIYLTNVTTFLNISQPLIEKIQTLPNTCLTLCAIGSISDREMVPFWQSFSKSKNILREYIHANISKNVHGVFINISSTEKEEERIFAHKKYWLSSKEVVNASVRAIEDNNLYWQEIDILKPDPEYYPTYYKDYEGIYKKWIFELYGKNI